MAINRDDLLSSSWITEWRVHSDHVRACAERIRRRCAELRAESDRLIATSRRIRKELQSQRHTAA